MELTRRRFIRNSAALYTALAALKSDAISFAAGETGLKDVFKNDFYIGTAISGGNMQASRPEYLELVAREFNAITMENNMKWGVIHPENDVWNWEIPDKFVDFGRKNNMFILGHNLVWHSQMARNGFVDADGNRLSRDGMLKMKFSVILRLRALDVRLFRVEAPRIGQGTTQNKLDLAVDAAQLIVGPLTKRVQNFRIRT